MSDIVERLRADAALMAEWERWELGNGPAPDPVSFDNISRRIAGAAAEIERLRALTTWQPIETAPKDLLKRVLLRFEGPFSDRTETGVAVGARTGDHWWLTCVWASSTPPVQPTHWRPLPPPPEDTP